MALIGIDLRKITYSDKREPRMTKRAKRLSEEELSHDANRKPAARDVAREKKIEEIANEAARKGT
jgi:hypothetical protein